VAAAQLLKSSTKEALLVEAASGLAAACAMELRSKLLTAAHAQHAKTVQNTLQEIHESSSTMRTVGALLVPRLVRSSIERDLAKAMVIQGENVSDLVLELETALLPLMAGQNVRV
jgi:hypothetical protein